MSAIPQQPSQYPTPDLNTEPPYALADQTSDSQELQRQLLAKMAAVVGAMGGLASWLYLTQRPFSFLQFAVLLSVLLWSALAWLWRFREGDPGRIVLLVGPLLSFAAALALWQGEGVLFFGVVVAVSAATLYPPIGAILSPFAISLLILFLRGDRVLWPVALTVLWTTAAIQWINTDGLFTVLRWSWDSQRRANDLLAELRGGRGQLNRTLHALREASRRLQRTGHELAEARLRAEEARRAKELFAANISHELRTPLNLIVGFSETMHLYPDLYGDLEWPAALRGDVYQIYASAQQLSDLIDDVLDLSRVDAQAMPVRREPADLGQVVTEAADSIRSLVRGKAVDIRTELPAGLPQIPIDRIRIRQVILNLLRNAARFTERGEIVVSVVQRDEDVVVAVRDTGTGIPEEERERIFDAFHQVDMALQRQEDGFGLGLAISRRFVALHGGHIWVESAVGEGSTFFFSLPLDIARGDSQLMMTDAPRPQRLEKPHLVLLSGEESLRELLERQMESYTVHWAESLGAARDLVYQHHPVAVIQNRSLGSDGTCEWLSDLQGVLPPRVPCISCAIPSADWMARQLGVDACLAKPLRRERFIKALGQFAPLQRLLVVDDDRGFYELLQRYLEQERRTRPRSGDGLPHDVRWAGDGREAIDLLEAWRPDLILLDLAMPRMDGHGFLQRRQEGAEWADVPIVLVTANQYGDSLAAQISAPIVLGRAEGYNTAEILQKLQALLPVSSPSYALPLPGRSVR